MTLVESLAAFCQEQGYDKTYWVAYSGGLDSTVLLTILSDLCLRVPLKLRAIHINHGLSPNANKWQQHCAQYSAALGVEYHAHTLSLQKRTGESLEELARAGRYDYLKQCIGPKDVLLTAHHQNDQAETLLLQLLRGAGPKGLAGMPPIKVFGKGRQGRPLLAFTRAELEAYALRLSLSWIEDESNQSQLFMRNFVRQQVIPLLLTRYPAATSTLARSARHYAEANALLEEYGARDCLIMQGSKANTLSVQALLAISPERQRHVLRSWIQLSGYRVPDAKRLAIIQAEILSAASDRNPVVKWGEVAMRRYRDDLYLLPRKVCPLPLEPLRWNLLESLSIAGLGTLQAKSAQGKGLRQDLSQLVIGFRSGGEKVQLVGRKGRHTLKHLFQEWDVPPWERSRVPLVFYEDKLIAVLGYFVDAEFAAREGEASWELILISGLNAQSA